MAAIQTLFIGMGLIFLYNVAIISEQNFAKYIQSRQSQKVGLQEKKCSNKFLKKPHCIQTVQYLGYFPSRV